jgi:CHAT domain-containing protein
MLLPLVFLNACGTSAITPGGVASFPSLFLKNGNRGFIGSETRISDKVAAAFSRSFYGEFVAGQSLGEAVKAAKWALLRQYNNPLGILYTNYANPDIRVLKPSKMVDPEK